MTKQAAASRDLAHAAGARPEATPALALCSFVALENFVVLWHALCQYFSRTSGSPLAL